MNRLVKLATLTIFGAGLALSGAACSGFTETRYEDCEVSDQYLDGDLTIRIQLFEADCGYWEKDGKYFLSEEMVSGGIWHWWSWVTTGQNSYHPEGWKPPHGLKPPKESKSAKERRKQHEKKTPANNKPTGSKNTTKNPVTGSGNQSIPKNDKKTTTSGGTTARKR
jgi:hypothetical protein